MIVPVDAEPHHDRTPTGFTFGLGLRAALARELFAQPDTCVDFLEIHPENYLGRGGHFRRMLDEARERWPMLVHGLSRSLASPEAFDVDGLRSLRALLRDVKAPFYSDHLCLSSFGNAHSYDLLPMPFNEAWLKVSIDRVRQLQQALEIPILVENVSSLFILEGSEWSEPEFLSLLVQETGCGLLLDVNNVFVNATNHGVDPVDWLRRIPMHRVMAMHMAGHETRPDGILIDTHAEPVCADVRQLFARVVQSCPQVPVLLERDGNYPPLTDLLHELDDLRSDVGQVNHAS